MALLDLADLLGSWELHLRAERKSPQTVKSYGDGVRAYLTWCSANGNDEAIDRRQLREFVDDLLVAGAKPATAVSRHLAVRRFSAWLTEEGEQTADPLLGLRSPKLDKPVVEPLTDEQLRAMVKACRGSDLRDKRDEAILRLMFTTGARAGEVVAMATGDLNLREDPPTAIIRRGKGGRGRVVPLAVETAAAIDRYQRARKAHRNRDGSSHPLRDDPALWVGDRGKGFTYDALHKTLAMRAQRAGVEGFHPHMLRHTAAHRWLARGGSEGGLMAVAGWTRPDMLLRYTKAQASARAAEEAQRLDLGGAVIFDETLRDIASRGQESQELALAYARRLRSRTPHAIAPEVEWRCREGCLLVAAYATPAGIVLYFPALRISRAYGATARGHQVRGSSGDSAGDDVLRLTERAWVLSAREVGVPFCCRHVWRTVAAEHLHADLAEAQSSNAPTRRVVA